MSDMPSMSEWEDLLPWAGICDFPKGYTMGHAPSGYEDQLAELRAKFGGSYENDEPYFRLSYSKSLERWRVERLCPCGSTACSVHVIPSEMDLFGELGLAFATEKVMTIQAAESWWLARGQIVVVSSTSVLPAQPWADVCTFPAGRELIGNVVLGQESIVLQAHFGNHILQGSSGLPLLVQKCPCGKTSCDIHIFPATVNYVHSFPLEMRRIALQVKTCAKRQKGTKVMVPVGEHFRLLDPMSVADASAWWGNIGLKCSVNVTPGNIEVLIKCKCGGAFAVVPCAECAAKALGTCSCGATVKKRKLKGGLCHDCVRKQVVKCPHCNQMLPRGHLCKAGLVNAHFSSRINTTYPQMIRHKLDKKGICPDCKQIVSYNKYHVHQYRCHSNVKSGGGYTRDYKLHKCFYCNYSNFDVSSVTTHQRSHILIREYECRNGCGKRFSTHAAELNHSKAKHGAAKVEKPSRGSFVRHKGRIVHQSAEQRSLVAQSDAKKKNDIAAMSAEVGKVQAEIKAADKAMEERAAFLKAEQAKRLELALQEPFGSGI